MKNTLLQNLENLQNRVPFLTWDQSSSEIITSQKNMWRFKRSEIQKNAQTTLFFLRKSLNYRLTDHLFWGKLAVVWTHILALSKANLAAWLAATTKTHVLCYPRAPNTLLGLVFSKTTCRGIRGA